MVIPRDLHNDYQNKKHCCSESVTVASSHRRIRHCLAGDPARHSFLGKCRTLKLEVQYHEKSIGTPHIRKVSKPC